VLGVSNPTYNHATAVHRVDEGVCKRCVLLHCCRQVAHLQATATAAASNVAVLRSQLAQAEHHSAGSKELKDRAKVGLPCCCIWWYWW
jgi:hypothetical protein